MKGKWGRKMGGRKGYGREVIGIDNGRYVGRRDAK